MSTQEVVAARANGRAQMNAARDEVVQEGPRALVWEGATFTLPPELPATFFFDMVEDEAQEDASRSFVLHAVRDLLGVDQWKLARETARERHLGRDAFSDLIEKVFGLYGMGPGEQSASQPSSSNDGDS